MNISVFGLGYVGAVSCACLPELGHDVIGVDTNPSKIRMINDGQSPVVEDPKDLLAHIGGRVGGEQVLPRDSIDSGCRDVARDDRNAHGHGFEDLVLRATGDAQGRHGERRAGDEWSHVRH